MCFTQTYPCPEAFVCYTTMLAIVAYTLIFFLLCNVLVLKQIKDGITRLEAAKKTKKTDVPVVSVVPTHTRVDPVVGSEHLDRFLAMQKNIEMLKGELVQARADAETGRKIKKAYDERLWTKAWGLVTAMHYKLMEYVCATTLFKYFALVARVIYNVVFVVYVVYPPYVVYLMWCSDVK